MESFGELLGRRSDAAIWRYFKDHWWPWFPGLDRFPITLTQTSRVMVAHVTGLPPLCMQPDQKLLSAPR